jgi:hypothetical protein
MVNLHTTPVLFIQLTGKLYKWWPIPTHYRRVIFSDDTEVKLSGSRHGFFLMRHYCSIYMIMLKENTSLPN